MSSGCTGVVVLVCEKFGVRIAAFEWWLWMKSWFLGFEETVLQLV